MKGIKRFITLILFAFFAFSVLACNTAPLEETPTGDNVGSFGTYENLKEYLETNAVSKDGYYYSNDWLEATAEDAVDSPTTGGNFDSETDRDYSKTNNQVEGVQESDRILTDGFKIYIVSGNKFFIVDADTLNIDFEFQFMEENTNIYQYGYLDDMYLYDNRIILSSYVYSYWQVEKEDCIVTTSGAYNPENPIVGSDDETWADGDETLTNDDGDVETTEEYTKEDDYYYYDNCIYYEYSYGTKIIVLDVEDSLDVTVERELYFESAYLVDTRMIDEMMYLILDNYMIRYGWSEELYIPRYSDTAVSNEMIQLPATRIFFMPNDGTSYGYLMLASFDVTDDEEVNVKAYLGNTWQLYMSLNNLYTIINQYEYNEVDGRYHYFTFVCRFEIEDGELVYKAMGEIEGSPLNQFSMDEYDGVFRIVTTGYSYFEDGWDVNNYLFTLDATTDEVMEQLAVMDEIGKPRETVYSVRFDEELLYVVTFERIDPMYKIDVSDPSNPVVLGQLEEPGVSDYMHIITDNLMLSIGRYTIEDNEWTRFGGVKVALYDTSLDNPVNIENYLVEGEYSYTNVMWDHKAFVYFTPEDADFTYVAIPVYEYFDGWWGYSQSMYVFKVYHSGDLEMMTKLTHMEETEEGYYSYYDSIERAVMIENYIYTVSYSSIKMFDINNGFAEVGSQELNENYYSIWGYPIWETTDAEIVD